MTGTKKKCANFRGKWYSPPLQVNPICFIYIECMHTCMYYAYKYYVCVIYFCSCFKLLFICLFLLLVHRGAVKSSRAFRHIVHYTYQHIPCIQLLTEPVYTTLYTTHMPCLVDYNHIGSSLASFKNLVTVSQENSTNQIATASLDLVTVSKELEVHKANS